MAQKKFQSDTISVADYSLQSGLKITRRRRDVESIEVLVSELRSVGSGNFFFALFAWLDGIAIGLLVSVVVTLMTVAIEDVFVYATFIALLCVSAFGFLTFSILAAYFARRSFRQIKEVIGTEEVEESVGIVPVAPE
jgi:hypothetical protein